MLKVQVSGLRAEDSGSRVQGPGFSMQFPVSDMQFSGFMVQVSGVRLRFQDSGLPNPCFQDRVSERAQAASQAASMRPCLSHTM